MQAMIRFPNGRLVQVLVLAMDRGMLRIAVPGYPDTLELKSAAGRWVSEGGQPVEVESLMMCNGLPFSDPNEFPFASAGLARLPHRSWGVVTGWLS